MSTDTTALELAEAAFLLARTRPTSREAVEFAAHDVPADYVRAIPVRTLVAEAPVLPPLNQRSITGTSIEALLAKGPGHAIIHDPRGVRIARLTEPMKNSNAVIVLVEHAWAQYATTEQTLADGTVKPAERPVDFARDVLSEQFDIIDYAMAA